jgi:hypothetical protein
VKTFVDAEKDLIDAVTKRRTAPHKATPVGRKKPRGRTIKMKAEHVGA